MNCSEGYSNVAELYESENCDVPLIALFSLNIISIILSAGSFIISGIVLGCRFRTVRKKKCVPKIFLFWSFLQNLVMLIRPVSILATGSVAWRNLWHLYIDNLSGATGAGVVIFFVYIEMNIIKNSELRKTQHRLKNYVLWFLYALLPFELILYILSPIGHLYGLYSANVTFWAPTFIAALIAIPFLVITGTVVYFRIRKMQADIYAALSKHVLTMVICCSIMGVAVVVLACISFEKLSINWVFIDLVWIMFSVFNCFLFSLISKKQAKYTVSTKTPTSGESV